MSLFSFFKSYFICQCFSAHDLEHDEDTKDSADVGRSVESISSLIITNILLGRCIGEPSKIDKTAFVSGVFEAYGNGNHVIDEEGMHVNIAKSLWCDGCLSLVTLLL